MQRDVLVGGAEPGGGCLTARDVRDPLGEPDGEDDPDQAQQAGGTEEHPPGIAPVAGVVEAAGPISGVVTVNRGDASPEFDEEGGLSGAPLREKSTALVRYIAANSKIPVIASGGICDAESAREKFDAGAQLVQLYTGFVYRGPRLLREIMEAT